MEGRQHSPASLLSLLSLCDKIICPSEHNLLTLGKCCHGCVQWVRTSWIFTEYGDYTPIKGKYVTLLVFPAAKLKGFRYLISFFHLMKTMRSIVISSMEWQRSNRELNSWLLRCREFSVATLSKWFNRNGSWWMWIGCFLWEQLPVKILKFLLNNLNPHG